MAPPGHPGSQCMCMRLCLILHLILHPHLHLHLYMHRNLNVSLQLTLQLPLLYLCLHLQQHLHLHLLGAKHHTREQARGYISIWPLELGYGVLALFPGFCVWA